jgi:hypothetical protein
MMNERIPQIPLATWASRLFPVKTPSIHTLRRWVREEKILPKPVKTGREYRVAENAVYINWNDPASVRAAHESTSTQ